MALVLNDRVKDTTTTTGTGNITLSGTAPIGYKTFSSKYATGSTNTFTYCIADSATGDWEIGVGYLSAAITLVRPTTVLSNSAGTTSKISFGAGSKDVFVTVNAGLLNGYGSGSDTTSTYFGAGTGEGNAGTSNVAIGAGIATSTSYQTVAIGKGAGYSGSNKTAITAIGYNAIVSANNGVSIGSTSSTYNGVALGTGSNSAGSDSVAIGQNSKTGNSETVAIGYYAGFNSSSLLGVQIGSYAGRNATGAWCIHIGTNSGFSNTGASNTCVGYESGKVNTTGISGVFLGYRSGYSNTTGGSNVFIGSSAGYTNVTGSQNTIIGTSSGAFNTASENTFVGFHSGYSNSTGTPNTSFGNKSAYSNTIGLANTSIGNYAAYSNVSGGGNVCLGGHSGYSNTASNCTFLGYNSGYSSTGASNTFVGQASGFSNTTGDSNVIVGMSAGYSNLTSSNNTMIGHQAGYSTTSANNTLVGYYAGNSTSSGAKNTFVGATAGQLVTSGAANTIIGSNTGAGIATSSNNILICDGDGNIRVSSDSTGVITIGGNLKLSDATATQKQVSFQTTSSNRWTVGSNATAETGSNAGSNFYIKRWDDTGTIIDTPFSITRSTGEVTTLKQKISTELVYDKTATIAIDTTGAYGWRDITSEITVKGSGSNSPTWSVIRDSLYGYTFSATVMNECWINFHINHDYAAGTAIYLHAHWVNAGTNTGTVRFGFEYSIAKGHQQEIFPASTIVYVEQACTGQYYHMVAEIGTGISSASLEPDSIVMVRLFRDATHVNDTCTDPIAIIMSDIHYQANKFATKNKAPAFNV